MHAGSTRIIMSLIAWITSVEGQEKIGNFRIKGQLLFTPVAIKN